MRHMNVRLVVSLLLTLTTTNSFKRKNTDINLLSRIVLDNQGHAVNYEDSANDIQSLTGDDIKVCSSRIELVESSQGSIVYPVSGLYHNNINCQWIIVAPTDDSELVVQLTLQRLSVETSPDCTDDSLSIYDTDGSLLSSPLCGHVTQPLTLLASGPQVTVSFRTDSSGRDAGFVLDYTAVTRPSHVTSHGIAASRLNKAASGSDHVIEDTNAVELPTDINVCSGLVELTDESGVIRYPSGSGLYPNNVRCRWKIAAPLGYAIRVLVTRIDIVSKRDCVRNCCDTDQLVINDGPTESVTSRVVLCGSVVPRRQLTTRSNTALITFTSNERDAGRGFEINYESFETTARKPPACSSSVVDLTTEAGRLVSPGFTMNRFPDNARCQWRITATTGQIISLSLDELVLEQSINCSSDSLTLYDGTDTSGTVLGRYCGSAVTSPVNVTSSTHNIYVTLVTDSRVNSGRFAFNWTSHTPPVDNAVTSGCGDVTTIVIGQTEGRLTSPGFGRSNQTSYPENSDCAWHIAVPTNMNILLRFESFSLEPPLSDTTCYDALTVYDGPTDAATVIGSYCGSQLPADILSSSNHLYVSFTSDGSTGAPGFLLHYSVKQGTGNVDGDDCGVPEVRPLVYNRIVGGVEAAAHSWPWLVSLQARRENWNHWCGGSLLTRRWIVTAAHCIRGYGSEVDFRVVAGEHNRGVTEGTEQLVTVERIIVHERYNTSNTDNDIALLYLSSDVTFSRYVRPVCLPREDVSASMMCITAGWGHTRSTGNSSVLNQIPVPILSHSQCNQRGWYSGRLTNNMLCAGYPEGRRDSCQGDSGGPLMCLVDGRWRLYGLTSWGEDCATVNKPGIYTRVAKFLAWIEAKTGVTSL